MKRARILTRTRKIPPTAIADGTDLGIGQLEKAFRLEDVTQTDDDLSGLHVAELAFIVFSLELLVS